MRSSLEIKNDQRVDAMDVDVENSISSVAARPAENSS